MKQDALPACIYPDVLSVGGVTYCASTEPGRGLVMRVFPDARLDEAYEPWSDAAGREAKLTAFSGLVLAAYQQGAEILVAHAQSGQRATSWAVRCNGNSPSAWGPGGLLGVQDVAQWIVCANWPDKPIDGPLGRPGNAEGISRFDGTQWLLQTDERAAGREHPDYAEDGSAAVWQDPNGGIAMQIGAATGVLLPGRITLAPRVTRQQDGRYTVVSYATDSHGAQPALLLTDVSEADLAEPPLPQPGVDPFHRPVPHFAYYTLDADRGYGDYYEQILHACWCATLSDVTKANEQESWVITNPSLIRKAAKPAMVILDLEHSGSSVGIQAGADIARELGVGLLIYDAGAWLTFPANIPSGAILAFPMYRDPAESIPAFLQRFYEATTRCQTAGFLVCPVLGCDDRLRTLSERQIIEAERAIIESIAELSNIAFVGVFSYARRGQMPSGPTGGGILHPTAWGWAKHSAAASDPVDFTQFRLPDPEVPDMPYAILAKQPPGEPVITVVKISEEPKDGKLFLNKPDGKKISMQPDGRIEDRAHDAYGPWEEFIKTPKGYVSAAHGEKYAIVAL